jgi:hypothetical protein
MKMFRSCVLLFGLALTGLAVAAHGQAIPAATQPGILTVGGDISLATTDVFTQKTTGVGLFANYDLSEHLSADLDVHIQSVNTPDDYIENTYLIGPRYNFHYGRYTPYVKVVAGIATTAMSGDRAPYQGLPPSGSFFAYAPGGGVDIKVKGHWLVRADIEQQFWPGYSNHGLTPVVGSFGIGYRFRP